MRYYGWPMQAFYRFDNYYGKTIPNKIFWGELALTPGYAEEVSGIELRLIVNILTAAVVLVFSALISELLIRRREARAP